ncbi:MAG: hypothetical protein K2N46_09330 [Lachnospiraceae bacterium]|nr:hypothetical protein [Lachnospiraceae bacterium]
MVLREKLLPCQSREAVITVLSYHNGIMDGYLQHPRLNGKEKIESLSQMVLLLNSLLDLENCLNSPLPLVRPECRNIESKAELCIQILFREHYTWQGRLIWQQEKQEYVFHSAIELIQLVDEILAE